MDSLVGLLEAVLAARRAAERIGIVARRGTLALGVALFGVVFALAALGSASAALWICALPLLGPIGTAGAAAGFFLLLAVAVLGVVRSILQPRRAKRLAASPDAAAIAEVVQFLADNKTNLLLAAFLAGLLGALKERR